MTAFLTIAEVTLRGLLGRRRTAVMLMLAGLPVLVALLARLAGGRVDEGLIPLLELGVRTVLPLTALIFGTSALGAEIEDGTIVFLVAKPVPRWVIALAKAVVAGLLAAALSATSALLTGIVAGGLGGEPFATTIAFAAAVAIAAFAYGALFVALSAVTGRALIVGLVYTLVWEAILAGILEGTRVFSLREATLALAAAFAPFGARIDADIALVTAVALIAIVVAAALAVTSARLATFEVRGTE